MSETENTKQSESRKEFLDRTASRGPYKRKDIFEDYDQTNSFEVDLPNTQNKMIISLHKRKGEVDDFLLRWKIGKTSMFIDAKTTFIVSEAMRHLTEDIVPEALKPLADMRQAEAKS